MTSNHARRDRARSEFVELIVGNPEGTLTSSSHDQDTATAQDVQQGQKDRENVKAALASGVSLEETYMLFFQSRGILWLGSSKSKLLRSFEDIARSQSGERAGKAAAATGALKGTKAQADQVR
jgi:hypothetical protein